MFGRAAVMISTEPVGWVLNADVGGKGAAPDGFGGTEPICIMRFRSTGCRSDITATARSARTGS